MHLLILLFFFILYTLYTAGQTYTNVTSQVICHILNRMQQNLKTTIADLLPSPFL